MKNAVNFTENKLLTFIIGILFMVLSLYIFDISFTYKSLLLSRIFPFIFCTLGFSFFRIALFSHTDSSVIVTIFKTFILLGGFILIEIFLEGIKISVNLRRTISIFVFVIISSLLWKKH
jgi:hypothetical protein